MEKYSSSLFHEGRFPFPFTDRFHQIFVSPLVGEESYFTQALIGGVAGTVSDNFLSFEIDRIFHPVYDPPPNHSVSVRYNINVYGNFNSKFDQNLESYLQNHNILSSMQEGLLSLLSDLRQRRPDLPRVTLGIQVVMDICVDRNTQEDLEVRDEEEEFEVRVVEEEDYKCRAKAGDLYVLGRTSDYNLYDFTFEPLIGDHYYYYQDLVFNIGVDYSLPRRVNNKMINCWELRISGNLNHEFEEELELGLGGIDNPELVMAIKIVFQRCPPPLTRLVSFGLLVVVYLYSRENESDWMMMSSIKASSSRRYVWGELETIKIEDIDKCAICLEEFVVGLEAAKLPCKHVFHGDCIRGWLDKRQTCPVCHSGILVPI